MAAAALIYDLTIYFQKASQHKSLYVEFEGSYMLVFVKKAGKTNRSSWGEKVQKKKHMLNVYLAGKPLEQA